MPGRLPVSRSGLCTVSPPGESRPAALLTSAGPPGRQRVISHCNLFVAADFPECWDPSLVGRY